MHIDKNILKIDTINSLKEYIFNEAELNFHLLILY